MFVFWKCCRWCCQTSEHHFLLVFKTSVVIRQRKAWSVGWSRRLRRWLKWCKVVKRWRREQRQTTVSTAELWGRWVFFLSLFLLFFVLFLEGGGRGSRGDKGEICSSLFLSLNLGASYSDFCSCLGAYLAECTENGMKKLNSSCWDFFWFFFSFLL